jgi:hypothetical protein
MAKYRSDVSTSTIFDASFMTRLISLALRAMMTMMLFETRLLEGTKFSANTLGTETRYSIQQGY